MVDRTRTRTAEEFDNLSNRGQQVLEAARSQSLAPDITKPAMTWPIGEVAKMIGRSTRTIRAAETETGGALKPKTVPTGKIKRREYRHEDILRLMEHFGRRPSLSQTMHLILGGYKGGSGKSALAAHMAHFFARRGYRVLAVDVDSQATLTQQLLGVIPDLEIEPYMTLAPIFSQDATLVDPVNQIHQTNWPTLHLIPSNLALLDADLATRQLAAENENFDAIGLLDRAFETIRGDYDIIIFDTPPTLSFLSICTLAMADMLLTPIPPRMADVSSTVAFLGMMARVVETFQFNIPAVRVVANMVSQQTSGVSADPKATKAFSAERELLKLLRFTFSDWMLNTEVLTSKAVTNSAHEWLTLYEVSEHDKVWKRAMSCMDSLGEEVEQLLVALDSHAQAELRYEQA